MNRLCFLLLAVFLTAVSGSASAVTFKWANDGDSVSMDPYNVNETFSLGFMANVYDALVVRDASLKIVPSLATSWKAVDPNTWEFKLRQGVKFHDGTPLTVQDVIFSYQRVISEGSDLRGNFASVAAVEAKGADTIVIKTRQPNPILLSYLVTWQIMSKTWAEKNNAVGVSDVRKKVENFATRNANGTGAFVLVSREPDVKTVLKRNPDWWGWKSGFGKSNLDEVIFTPVKQDATRVSALLSGDVDMIYSVPIQDGERIKGAGKTVYAQPETRTIFLSLDQARPELLDSNVKGKNPFKDQRVRLALYKAIDVDAIVGKIMQGGAAPANAMVVPVVTGHDPKFKRLGYNEAEAKRLLAEAGYPDGFSFGFDCPNDRYVNDEKVCQAVAAMWSRIGLKPKLLAQTKSLYFNKILSRNTSSYLLGWSPVTIDGLDALDNLLATPNEAAKMGRFNLGGYSSAKVDELANQARGELNAQKRTRLLQDALDLAHKEVGSIPLHFQVVIWASAPNVTLSQRADNYFQWYFVNRK